MGRLSVSATDSETGGEARAHPRAAPQVRAAQTG